MFDGGFKAWGEFAFGFFRQNGVEIKLIVMLDGFPFAWGFGGDGGEFAVFIEFAEFFKKRIESVVLLSKRGFRITFPKA